jgi:hypothetical protein
MTGRGYSVPDLRAIALGYGLGYRRVEGIGDIRRDLMHHNVATVIEVVLDSGTLIEPKLEMGRPINDQFPYLSNERFAKENRYVSFAHPR